MLTPDEQIIQRYGERIREAKEQEELAMIADQIAYDASMGAIQVMHGNTLLQRVQQKIDDILEQQ